MPLKRDEWAKGRKVTLLERSVLDFLKENREKAYTTSEIAQSLYKFGATSLINLANMVLTTLAIESSLKDLVRDGLVKSKQIEGFTYYIAA